MNDRELLELAAKAAGHEISTHGQRQRDAAGFGHVGLWIDTGTSCWNPLENDGHALQLVVALCLSIEPGTLKRGFAVARTGHANWKEFREKHKGNRAAATRRAIVRAAAELAPERKNA